MEQIQPGDIQTKISRIFKPAKGEAYGHIEGPKGELGFYLVSDGSANPYRWHMRPPSLINLTALRELLIGVKIADAMAIFGSIDICVGEVDR
jgi:NADH-quinone oxidoreductase subunit D